MFKRATNTDTHVCLVVHFEEVENKEEEYELETAATATAQHQISENYVSLV